MLRVNSFFIRLLQALRRCRQGLSASCSLPTAQPRCFFTPSQHFAKMLRDSRRNFFPLHAPPSSFSAKLLCDPQSRTADQIEIPQIRRNIVGKPCEVTQRLMCTPMAPSFSSALRSDPNPVFPATRSAPPNSPSPDHRFFQHPTYQTTSRRWPQIQYRISTIWPGHDT